MLWLCVHLRQLSLEVLVRGGQCSSPFGVSDGDSPGSSILQCNGSARASGIQPGMTLGAARALVPRLQSRCRDEGREQKALAGLAAWAGQFSSVVSLAPPREILIEGGGSLRLFDGIGTFTERVRAGLLELGYQASLAWAPTPLGAALLARADQGQGVRSRRELAERLAELNIEHLGLSEKGLTTLRGIGVCCIGQLDRLPRDGLARRLGLDLLDLLDRAMGRAADPRPSFQPPLRFCSHIPLPEEVERTEGLLLPIRRQLAELCGSLRAQGGGVERLLWKLYHRQCAPTRVLLSLRSPSRDAEHLQSLFFERLTTLRLSAPVQEIALQANRIRAVGPASGSLFAEPCSHAEQMTVLLERLRARLGNEAVCGLCPVAEHRPEYAWRPCSPGEAEACGGVKSPIRPRPLWLLQQPVPLSDRNDRPLFEGELTLESEAERIEAGWWDGRDVARDYFIACNSRGERFWVFRERRSGPCRWFLHGLFA